MLREQDQEDEEDSEEEEDDNDDEDKIDEGNEMMSSEEKTRVEKQKKRAKQCTVLVELLQKNGRQNDQINFMYIAFHVYKVIFSFFVYSFFINHQNSFLTIMFFFVL